MDPLYELLSPYFDQQDSPSPSSPHTATYFNRLSALSLSDLTSTEPASLLQAAQSHLRNLQALSKRSHRTVITSSSHLANLAALLPDLQTQAQTLKDGVPDLEHAAAEFARKYERSTENVVLDRRKRAILLNRNSDRVSDVLDLPSLLSSTVSAAQSSTGASTSSTATTYASALDLHAHIRRLNGLYPHSNLVKSISIQAETEMENLGTILITSLQSPSLKLAGAMRTIGWLRRVTPDFADDGMAHIKSSTNSSKSFDISATTATSDGSLASLFLFCRLQTLHNTLTALEPLRDLADQETTRRKSGLNSKLLKQQVSPSALGSQSERYLKRYIEIFREQSFSIVSMYKSVFPSDLPTLDSGVSESPYDDVESSLPSPLADFSLHIVEMLTATLRIYLPNVADRSSRESLLTQVLYCAGSLGRLGADFGMMVALLDEDLRDEVLNVPEAEGEEGQGSKETEAEWVEVMKKHRVQASRLEILARGVGSSRKASWDVQSPGSTGATSPVSNLPVR